MASSLTSRPARAAAPAILTLAGSWPEPLAREPRESTASAELSDADLSLVLVRRGRLEISLDGTILRLAGPDGALLLPDPETLPPRLQACLSPPLRLSSRRLAGVAARLSGHAWPPRRFEQLLARPMLVAGGDGPANRQLRRLGELLPLLQELSLTPGTEEARQLGVEELIDRLVVTALWGERLLAPLTGPEGGGLDRSGIIEELVGWIRANSQRPITLADLERRSGYSQRSLRNAFQERFGCPPKQWIRQARMEAARTRLQEARPGESVSTIAREHGYSHVSQFSRDFRQVFGVQPSMVLRRGRSRLEPTESPAAVTGPAG